FSCFFVLFLQLYVTDRLSNDVIVVDLNIGQPIHNFTQSPRFVYEVGRSTSALYRPTGITIDEANRRLLICDKDNHRVASYTMDGHFISSFGTKGKNSEKINV